MPDLPEPQALTEPPGLQDPQELLALLGLPAPQALTEPPDLPDLQGLPALLGLTDLREQQALPG